MYEQLKEDKDKREREEGRVRAERELREEMERRTIVGHVGGKEFLEETAGYMGVGEHMKIMGLSRQIGEAYMGKNKRAFVRVCTERMK